MRNFLSDLRLVCRQLGKSPGFAAAAILMLALGIGATTAIFSVIDGVLLRPLPFPDPSRLVTLGDQLGGTNWGQQDAGPVTGPEVLTYSRDTRSFTSLGGYQGGTYELAGVGEPAQVNGTRMTAGVFSALGVAPLLGRVFTAQEDEQKQQVAVLSYATWKSRFGGNPRILGAKILLYRKPYLIIGVMPRDFEFPLIPGRLNRSELWVPMSFTPLEISAQAGGSWNYEMVGRLKTGVTLAQAQNDAERIAQQIMRAFPPDLANFHIRAVVYPLQQITVLQTRPLLRMLFLAVAVVLLIACANLAGLLLVRAIRRQREIAVRLALGAPAARLLRQTMLESLVLSGIGGLLGIAFAAIALGIGRNLLPETLPRVNEIVLNWRVAGFALLLAVFTGLCCGLAPAFAALRTNVNASLKEGGRSGSVGGSHARLRSTLVVVEIAVALILLTASGLLLRSFANMSDVDLGFRPEHVTTAAYSLPQKSYAKQAQVDAFNNELLRLLRQLPGVESAALTSVLPASGGAGLEAFVVDGYVNPREREQAAASPLQIVGNYFGAMGMRLLRGRVFTQADDANGQLVIIVNHEFAQHYWPHQDPIGKRMRIGSPQAKTPWMTVVGEIADAKLVSPDADATEQFYQPVAQLDKDAGALASPEDINGNGGFIVVRSALPPQQVESALRATVRSIDAQLPLAQIQTMEQVVFGSEAPRRFNTIVISGFALAAVLLAVLGIYSVIAFSVASRVQEMAIRMALGSQRSGIMRLIVQSGLRLAAVGCGLGLAGAVAASSLLRAFLFGVSPFDPLIMVLAAIAVFLLALVASAFPARRAASVDPMQALRGE
jgi:predicted permease